MLGGILKKGITTKVKTETDDYLRRLRLRKGRKISDFYRMSKMLGAGKFMIKFPSIAIPLIGY